MRTRAKNVYKKWWFWVLLLAVILSIPFLINEFYLYGNETGKAYFTLWGAKDVLTFYGSLLAFIGTVALGALALWQNKNAYKKSEELTLRQLKMAATENKNIELNFIKQTIKESVACFDINIFHIVFEDVYMYVKNAQELINLAQSNRRSIFNAGVNLAFLKNLGNNAENCQNCEIGCDFKGTSEEYKRLLVDFRDFYQSYAEEFTKLLTESEAILKKLHCSSLLENDITNIKEANNRLVEFISIDSKESENRFERMLEKNHTEELFDTINKAQEASQKNIDAYFSKLDENNALIEKIEKQLYTKEQNIKDNDAINERIHKITNVDWYALRNKAISFIKRCDLEMEDNFNKLINSR